MKRITTLWLVILCGGPGWAEEPSLAPYFAVEGDPTAAPLRLVESHTEVEVAGAIAEVTVTQTYRNPGFEPLHARYVFPASVHAAVHGMRMRIGEELIVAEIRERRRASEIFATARQDGKAASLLEQERPNVFSMRVANIPSGDRVEVELRYTELLVPEAGQYSLVVPAAVGPRYDEESPAPWAAALAMPGPAPGVSVSGTIAAGLPIDAIESPSHDVELVRRSALVADFSLDQAAGDRDFVLRYRLDGERIRTGLTLLEGDEENYFSLVVQPPRQPSATDVPPREYVFVVDVSGSMGGFPLDTAKELLRDLIEGLRPVDSFNVMFFSGGSSWFRPRPVPATAANLEDALRDLDERRSGGGTRLLDAMRAALAVEPEGVWSRSLVVVTDGFISAEREVFEHVRAHLDETNVFAFGVGTSVNRYLIEGLARAGLGRPFVIDREADVAEVAARFRRYVATPLLTNVGIDFGGFHAYDVEPESIPDLLAERPLVIHGKWRGARSGEIGLRGETGSGRFETSFDVANAELVESEALRYLWARTRIARISDFAFAGETEEDRHDLVELGLAHNLLTRHTSFVAVHGVVRNPGGAGEVAEQALARPRGAIGVGSEPEWPSMLLVLSAALLAARLARRRWA